ncbi:Coronin-7 [Triplophysa tibetana]|uniref:Coronin-7 n=1 Tax=Triplophysa tibetana TaxID=1572043 RepID=A0A5A9NBI2_9TELE|nr:Coronin-7 [Triplophysa tibetana]
MDVLCERHICALHLFHLHAQKTSSGATGSALLVFLGSTPSHKSPLRQKPECAQGLLGNKDSRILWVKDDNLLTTGFNQVRQQEVRLWDSRKLSSSLRSVSLATSNALGRRRAAELFTAVRDPVCFTDSHVYRRSPAGPDGWKMKCCCGSTVVFPLLWTAGCHALRSGEPLSRRAKSNPDEVAGPRLLAAAPRREKLGNVVFMFGIRWAAIQ